jgi:hypothetical protein
VSDRSEIRIIINKPNPPLLYIKSFEVYKKLVWRRVESISIDRYHNKIPNKQKENIKLI